MRRILTTATLARLLPDSIDAGPEQDLLKALARSPNTDVETTIRVADRLAGRLGQKRDPQYLFDRVSRLSQVDSSSSPARDISSAVMAYVTVLVSLRGGAAGCIGVRIISFEAGK
jgi:DNA-binding IclR family transcriptional regulator